MLTTYLLCPPGPRRDAVTSALDPVTVLDDAHALSQVVQGEGPALVLVDVEAWDDAVLSVLRSRGGEVSVALMDGPAEALEFRALSLDQPRSLEDVARFARDPEANKDALLFLPRVVAEIARARHDVNNPLTSAMAETQLLLLDLEEGEAREGVEVVQTQLRRIRDMVAATGHLRPPRDG